MNWYVAHIAGAIFLYSICAPLHLEAQERPCLDGSGAEGVAACDARLADPSNLTPSEVAAYRRARAGHRLDVSDHAGALADLDALSQFDAASTLHHYRRALALKEFELDYQPQIDLSSDRPVGFEALLRWKHPKRGRVSPLAFIPLAEETGLITPIGEWVIRTACHEASSWPGDISIAINVSAVQFRGGGLVGRSSLGQEILEKK